MFYAKRSSFAGSPTRAKGYIFGSGFVETLRIFLHVPTLTKPLSKNKEDGTERGLREISHLMNYVASV